MPLMIYCKIARYQHDERIENKFAVNKNNLELLKPPPGRKVGASSEVKMGILKNMLLCQSPNSRQILKEKIVGKQNPASAREHSQPVLSPMNFIV